MTYSALPNPGHICDLPGLNLTDACRIINIGEGVKEVADSAKKVVDFASDPVGYLATKLQEAAAGLAEQILTALSHLTHPNLSAEWFIESYRVSFALSIFVLCLVLGWNFVQLARRRISGDEMAETLWFYTPVFFIGSMFGPLIGSMFVKLAGAFTDALTGWALVPRVEVTQGNLTAAIAAGHPEQIAGGAIVAIVVYFLMIIALLMVLAIFLVMLVAQYLSGVVLPLGLVWLLNPRDRSKGLRIVLLWVGILFSEVLLYFLLGVVFSMVGGVETGIDGGPLKVLVELVVAMIAMVMATLSPFMLARFAPVGLTDSAIDGPTLQRPRWSGGAGPPSADDGQLAQSARSSGGRQAAVESDEEPGAMASASSGGGSGGLGGKLRLMKGGQEGGEGSSLSAGRSPSGGEPASGEQVGAGTAASSESGAAAGAGGLSAGAGTGGAAGAGAGAGAAAGGGAAVAAGAAPLAPLAAALGKAIDVAQTAGGMAAGNVDAAKADAQRRERGNNEEAADRRAM